MAEALQDTDHCNLWMKSLQVTDHAVTMTLWMKVVNISEDTDHQERWTKAKQDTVHYHVLGEDREQDPKISA